MRIHSCGEHSKPVVIMLPAEKKYLRECKEARQDSFKRIMQFIDELSEIRYGKIWRIIAL